MADEYDVMVAFKAKYDEVTRGFDQITKGTTKVVEGNKKAERSFDELGMHAKESANTILNEWLGLGIALSAAGLIEFFNRTVDAINKVTDTAAGLGVSADALQQLGYAAEMSGVNAEDAGDGMRKFAISVGQALQGNQELIDSFRILGVNVEQLRGKDLATQYATVASSAVKLKDNNVAAANAMAVFGRSYTTALQLGRDGIQRNIDEFKSLGVALTDTQRAAVKEFDDAKTRLGYIFDGFFQKLVADSTPAFNKLIDGIQEFIQASGGVDALATNVGNKIVDIVKATVDTFNALKPGFTFLLDSLKAMVSIAQSTFTSARNFANTYSDNLSQGNTNGHVSNPGVADFVYDFTGGNAKDDSWWERVKARFDNLLHPFDVAPQAFNNYDPNAGRKYYTKGSMENPYLEGTNAALTNLAGNVAADQFSTSVSKATKATNDFGEALQKSNDSITNAFKSLDAKDKNNELNKIFSIIDEQNAANARPDQPGQNFEKDAADLIQAIKAGNLSSTAFNAGLDLLRQDRNYNTAAGFNTNGFDQVIEEIQKYAQSLGVQKTQVEVGITVTPTKDFAVKVFTNQDALPYLAGAIAGAVADAANQGAHT